MWSYFGAENMIENLRATAIGLICSWLNQAITDSSIYSNILTQILMYFALDSFLKNLV